MNMSEIFIKRPVATTLLVIGILFGGMMSYSQLPVTDMPNVEFPYIVVFATMPGADPETMANSVAKPLEQQFSSISGIKNMTSESKQGFTMVFLEIEMDRNIDGAALDVQSAISLAYGRMPDTMSAQPRFLKVNPDAFPILQLALTSEALTGQELTKYAESYISQRLSMVDGVANTSVRGAKRFAVRVQIDPDLMVARNVSVDEIMNAVNAANSTLPTGTLQGHSRIRNIRADGALHTAEEFGNIIVAWRKGAPVRLQDVAIVADGVENTNQASWINGKPGIIVQVTRQPGGNTVQVARDVLALLLDIEASLPPSVHMELVQDRSVPIQESVYEVLFTLVLTIFLVIGVIYVFLRDGMATLIPSLALPLSIVGTFALMFFMNFSIDNISLMALILVVGFVVDDAIVMLENIIRHREMGKSPFHAALDGSREVGFTIMSMTISLGAVFIPLLFMPGLMGRMFFEFAAVIIIAISMSFFVSISLTPMMSAHFLTEKSIKHEYHGFKAVMENLFKRVLHAYERSLRFTMRHKFLFFLGSLMLIGGIYGMSKLVPTGFMPSMDGGNISIVTRAEESIAFPALAEAQVSLHKYLDSDPAVRNYTSTVGGGMRGETNSGQMLVRLKPISERDHINDVIARLRVAMGNHPTLDVFISNADTSRGGGTGAMYSYTLIGSDIAELYGAAMQLEDALQDRPELRDVGTNLQLMSPTIRLDIDRDKATSVGISPVQIENALYSAFGSRDISTIYTDISDYTVKMEVRPDLQNSADILAAIYLRSIYGPLVPLDTLATMGNQAGPLKVNHRGQFPSVDVTFNIAEGYSMGEAVDAVISTAELILPDSVNGRITGEAEEFQSSMGSMLLLIGLALILIYIVLGILYESFIHPITILSGLPSAGFGAVFALWLFNSELNIVAMVGILMLMGIVKKNAIMVLDFALAEERKGNLPPEEAVVQGCLIRFRPILMTTFAAVMGSLPLALGIGATGADMRQPIGICVSGGLVFSQLVTLYITPVYYVYLDKFGAFVKRQMARLFRRTIAVEEPELDALRP